MSGGSIFELGLEPGALIAERYKIVDFVGSGTMGIVIRALDLQRDYFEVALKILRPELVDDDLVVKRLENEVVLTREFKHENLVRVYDYERRGDLAFIAMEYVNGTELYSLMYESDREFTFLEAVSILQQVANGVAYAHEKGVIHRDIKPENIIISYDGVAKVTDFGFAKAPRLRQRLTLAGQKIGTPLYMAPEQFGSATVDARVDVYSLGLLAYELVVGSHPFGGNCGGGVELIRKHLEEPLPEFKTVEAGAPLWFEELIQKCAQKKRKNRFNSATEFSDELNGQLDQLESRDTKPRPQVFEPIHQGRKPPRRGNSSVISSILSLLKKQVS